MDIVGIVDDSVDESLQYYQSRACEKRVTEEAIRGLLLEVCSEAVVEISNEYITNKPRPIQLNPLLEIIAMLSDEVTIEMSSAVAKIGIREIVEGHLADRELYNALKSLICEVLESSVLTVAEECIFEEACTDASNAILSSFLRSKDTGLYAIAQESLQEEIDCAVDFNNRQDRIALNVAVQKAFGRRALLSHLMASMSSGFDRVIMTHYTKGVLRRKIIQRLFHLMVNIEQRIQPTINNNVEAFVFEKVAVPSIQEEFIDQILTSVIDMENDIDFVELCQIKENTGDKL